SANAATAASLARKLDVGRAKPYRSIAEMVMDKNVDAIWLCGPNHSRIENVEEIVDTVHRGRGELKGIACEKPLARNVAEAERVDLMVGSIGVQTGSLDTQPFPPHTEPRK